MARPQGIKFTSAELHEFDRLSSGMCSIDQMTRVKCRLRWPAFYAKHGEDKCAAMRNELVRKGEWKSAT